MCPLFVEACLADPIYGGDRNSVFWKMIGYPGLPVTHALDMARYRSPQEFIPGNIMPFSGVPESADRASLIAYLRTLK